jgi:hypothetical protein
MDTARFTILRRVTFGAILVAVFALASGFTGCPSYSNLGGGGGTNPGSVMATPNPLTLSCVDTTFSVSQIYYSGAFTPSGVDATKITVTATSPPNTFLVHQVSGAAFTTSFIVTGGGGMQTTESVNAASCACVRHHDMWQHARVKAATPKSH